MDLAREEEIRLVKDEYNRLVSGYNRDSFVLNCKFRSRLLIEDHRDGAMARRPSGASFGSRAT